MLLTTLPQYWQVTDPGWSTIENNQVHYSIFDLDDTNIRKGGGPESTGRNPRPMG